MILGTIVPNSYHMPFESVKCWMNLPYKKIWHEGSTLSNNRNQIFNKVKDLGDSLLFIDSDIIFTEKDVKKIEKHLETYDSVTGVYSLTFPPYNPAIFRRVDNDYAFMPIPKQMTQIGASGGGFLGISKKVIDKLPYNPFTNKWEGNVQHGEDVSFGLVLEENGFSLWCDPLIQVGQIRLKALYPNEYK